MSEESGPCCGRFCDVPDSPLCTCPPDVKEANKKKYSLKKFFGPNYFDPLRDLKNQAMGGTDNCEDCGMPKRGGDNELMFADDEMCDCSFEKAWGVVKAAPCPQCGAGTGERCGKNPRNPANRCKLRRRSMESDRDTSPSTWKE